MCRAIGEFADRQLTDFVGRPRIDGDELDRERGVVVQEIARANDQPSVMAEHLIDEAAFGDQTALAALIEGMGYQFPNGQSPKLTETVIMLAVLALIDVVMISNLLIMVIVGGYETFVSRLGVEGHPDQPEWLDHVNAGVLKVKLSMALISISSIHLLKTFINPDQYSEHAVMWQVIIHVAFLASALIMAWVDRLTTHTHPEHFNEPSGMPAKAHE